MRKPLVASMLVFSVWSCISLAAENPQAVGLNEQIVETHPRDGVYQRSILSRRVPGGEKWLVVAFPGYPGILRIQEKDSVISYELAGNFLVRARRHLVSTDIAVATLDCPSDEFSNCGDNYRDSDKHVNDVLAQIDALKAIVGKDVKVAVIGTSYGTVSSELLAKKLDGEIDAAIHTASFTAPSSGHGLPLWNLDLSKIKTRQLLVHHQNDPCSLTKFDPLKKYQGHIPMLLVKGVENPHGNACDAFTQHGFVGREVQVMTRIGEWLATDHIDPVIE
jgi:hypothetical protein